MALRYTVRNRKPPEMWTDHLRGEQGYLMSLPSYPLTEWNVLLAVQAGAAATLTGLVFVAVSINLDRIVGFAGLPGRAAESLLQFLGVFFVATLALIPSQPARDLGIELLAVGVILWLLQTSGQIRYRRQSSSHPLAWLVPRVLLTQLSTLPFCVAGIGMMLGMPSAVDWLVPGFLFSFVAGVMSAWVLLVEILR